MTNFYIYLDKKKSSYCNKTVTVTVLGPFEVKSNGTYTGFNCFKHTFTAEGICKLMLYNSYAIRGGKSVGHLIGRIVGFGFSNVVYVYFYGEDPRPLLLCYGNSAFIPSNKDEYECLWKKKEGIEKCVCEGTGEEENEELLKALVKVVGFLNEVDLSKHPPGTPNGQCNTGSPSVDTATTCGTAGQETNSSCTYTVDTYNTKQVQIRVMCEPVNGSKTGNGTSCYRKLTHQPAGFSGDGATTSSSGDHKGFRLGKVVYKNNVGGEKGKIQYYPSSTSNRVVNGDNISSYKYQPLVKVSAYFYNADKHYNDPLLVELEFKNNGDSAVNGKACEYYKLTTSGTSMKWTNDPGAAQKVKETSKLVAYLDEIRCELKQVLQIKLEKNTTELYPLMGRPGKPGGDENGFKPLKNGDKNVEVKECQDGVCQKLKENKYKCYRHQIQESLGGIHNQVAGLAFTIPGVGNPIEIKLFNGTADGIESTCETGEKEKKGTEVTPLTYNSCMEDVYVFFYGDDPRPLMLCYNKAIYRPKNMNDYFDKWVKIKDCNVKKCECAGGSCDGRDDSNCCKLLKALVRVSNFLNPVNIKEVPGDNCTSSCYYVHWFGGSMILMKVEKTKHAIDGFCYNKYTHTHFGTGKGDGTGFRLGTIDYGYRCIKDNNGDKCITSQLKNEGSSKKHESADKVVVYYYGGDKDHKNPLLVALKTSNGTYQPYYELQNSEGTGSKVKKYNKGKGTINLSDSPGSSLERKLNNIMCQIRKKVLQIILDKRPVIQQYTPGVKTSDCNESADAKKIETLLNERSEMDFNVMNHGNTDKPPTYHLPTKTCYKAQFYENGQATAGTNHTSIVVKEQQCKELAFHGYRCYVHDIVNAKDIYEIGWLRFYLWDNTKGQGGPECTTTTTGAGCTNASTDTNCKELCLYKECSDSSDKKTILKQVALISVH